MPIHYIHTEPGCCTIIEQAQPAIAVGPMGLMAGAFEVADMPVPGRGVSLFACTLHTHCQSQTHGTAKGILAADLP